MMKNHDTAEKWHIRSRPFGPETMCGRPVSGLCVARVAKAVTCETCRKAMRKARR